MSARSRCTAPRCVRSLRGRPFPNSFRSCLAPFSPAFSALVFALLIAPPQFAIALPMGGQLVAGNVAATANATQLTLDQASRAAIMNWQSFNIAPNELVRIVQSGADAALLARVTGGDPTRLLGSLKADGKLFLINPKGILVGPGAAIDTAAFLASTLDVADADFLKNGPLTFKGDSTAGVVNLGTITAREGNVLLLAQTVKNAGKISAGKGTAGLGAGTEVYLASPDAPDFVIKTNLAATGGKTGVDNSGTIAAAQAQLEAAGGSLYDLAVNQSGTVRAAGIERTPDGRVLLTAGGGNVSVTGTVSARDADGSGGEILVGGDTHGANSAVADAARTYVGPAATLDASAAATGAGGKVVVWADNATRFLGSIAARGGSTGGDGGFAEVSGKHQLDFSPAVPVDLSSPAGHRGTLLLDPDALVVSASADSGTSTSGTDPFVFGPATEPATLNVTTLQNQLATTDVTLDTSTSAGDVTFDAPVTWSSDSTLRVNAGNNINLNADITAAGGTLALYAGRQADGNFQLGTPELEARIDQAATSTLDVSTLTLGLNSAAAVPGEDYADPAQTGPLSFEGNLHAGTINLDLTAGSIGSFVAGGAGTDTEVGTLQTTGSGSGVGYLYFENSAGDLSAKLALADSDTAWLQVATPGDLTLLDGSGLSFVSQTSVVLASTNGRFVNEAGASAIGANGRFLIYSSTPAATVADGLVADQSLYSHPFDDNDDFSGDTFSRFLYRYASSLPALTYTADDKTRTYGAANPAFTATRTGLLDGVPDDVAGAPAFSTTATLESGVNTYAIDITQGTLASDNYSFAFVPGTLTVTRAPLTITALDASRTPTGDDPDFKVSYDGFVLGQDQSVVSGLDVATTATSTSPIGTYPVTPSGATAANYAITYVPGTFTITDTALLHIAADDFSRLYGAADPTFTATYSGFIGKDTAAIVTGLQFSTTTTVQSGVGSYTIVPYGAYAPGYLINYASGTLTVTPAPLTITGPSLTRTYGDANPALTPTFTGLMSWDSSSAVSGLMAGTTATQSSSVGDYAVTLTGGTAANYTITRQDGSLHISPAALTVKADDASRTYGDADPTFTLTALGLKNNDTLDGSVFVTQAPYTLASDRSPVGNYAIQGAVAARNGNYVATFQDGTLTIRPRPLTISADSMSRLYGDPNPAFTATFSGLASFDSPSVITGLDFNTQATQSSGASTFGIFVNSDANSNYDITYQAGQLTINPAPLTFQPLGDLSRVYGRANPDPALPTVSGLKLSDTAQNLGLSYSFPAPTADAGDYTYSLTTTNPNYTLSSSSGAFHVTPAPLTVQLGGGGRLYGDPNPTDYGTRAQGLAFDDTLASILRIDNPADPTASVGTYQLSATLLSPDYYIASASEGAFKVNPRQLTVDIASIARYYGDATPDFSWTIGGDGLASFDNASAVFLGVKTAVPVTETTDIGLYRLDPVTVANPNYLISWWPGWLAILPRPIEIMVNNAISFGNNHVPANFDPVTDKASLVTFEDPARPGGYGYEATVTGLPSFVNPAEFASTITYQLSDTNDPSPVGTAMNPADFKFPARPAKPTPPQATTDPLPADLPDATSVVVTPGTVIPDAAPPATTPTYTIDNIGNIIVSKSVLTFNLDGSTADKTSDRFADVIKFVMPQSIGGIGDGNYVVTKITNGVLTMKADPVVVQQTLDHEAALAKYNADKAAFYQTGSNSSVISVAGPVAFNLPRDLIPSIRAALGLALWEELMGGNLRDKDSLATLINGGKPVDNYEQLTEPMIMAWLADIHTNATKQALLMPWMINYTMNLATRDPSTLSATEAGLVKFIEPALQKAHTQFVDNLAQAKQDWYAAQADIGGRGSSLYGLLDGKVPWESIVTNAVTGTMSDAMTAFATKLNAMSSTGADIGAGLIAGGEAGVISAIAANSNKMISRIFPGITKAVTKGLKNVALKTGEKVTEALIKRSVAQAGAKLGSKCAGAIGSAVAFAVSTAVTEGFAVADDEKQKQEFDAILATRNDTVDPHKLLTQQSGKAIMMLGLTNLFMGGG